jgi:ribosomal protein S18 acetylase RimI-like enzyme
LFVRAGHSGAIRLYQRLGFKIEGRFERRVRLADGNIEDDVAMALLL